MGDITFRDDPTSAAMSSKALRIYLQDHHAAALAGTAVARRVSRNASRDLVGVSELARVAEEIAEDLASLERIMATADISHSPLKDTLVVVAEHLGRLKLNGRFFRRARLSDVIELETLYVGITGKLALWQTLSLTGSSAEIDLVALMARAIEQRCVVSRCHQSASSRTFGVRA